MNESIVKTALFTLGMRAKDKVTGFEGMVASVNFDAYGCVQAWLTPKVREDGKIVESQWFDFKRIEVFPQGRIMDAPSFEQTKSGTENGSNELSAPRNA